ncbi:MAG: hypothetical protein M3541_02445 [Acidobacteriota bacterium]|nr:hypothetical protein [Acidobacteriota bacterium]
MNTRLLMTASAIFLGAQGMAASFLPSEILDFIDDIAHNRVEAVLVQLFGAALIGFAMMNWMARGAPAGGIYGRPIIAGTLVQYAVGGIALLKMAALGALPAVGIVLTIVYCGFTIAFAVVMFGRGPIGAIEHSGPG